MKVYDESRWPYMAGEQVLTKDMLKAQLGALGVEQGMKILVHVALSKVGRLYVPEPHVKVAFYG